MSKTWIAARGRNSMLWIEPYYRIRDGVLQHLRGHWRSLPSSKPLRAVQMALSA